MNMHFVLNYSEGVSCQSQRRFPEEMGESSTGERVKENDLSVCLIIIHCCYDFVILIIFAVLWYLLLILYLVLC